MKKLLIAGIAALLMATSGAHATERLPEAMLGNWCWIEGGDEQNWNQQIFARVPPGGCHGGEGNPGGSLEATRRSFNKDFLLALAADFKKHGAEAIESGHADRRVVVGRMAHRGRRRTPAGRVLLGSASRRRAHSSWYSFQ